LVIGQIRGRQEEARGGKEGPGTGEEETRGRKDPARGAEVGTAED
jgi:hypothetical protein